MDYTNPAYFAGAGTQPPYHFIGIPPLTPSHSNSAASDDFNASPQELFDQFPNGLSHDQFQNFEAFAQFNTQPSTFAGPPTPPTQQLPPTAQPINGAIHLQHSADLLQSLNNAKGELADEARARRQGSNSDEDENLTPAQSRRKAQNRAAQRAFRERKERHVKELENRLQQLEEEAQLTRSENEKLKQDLQKISTENEILRATSLAAAGAAVVGSPLGSAGTPMTTGPMSYKPTDFYSNLLENHNEKTPSHRVVKSENGERLLAAGAAWDLMQSHELFKRGLVDIQAVSELLKGQAKCDGQGPVFEERAIVEAIEQSVASGSDELL
ncbi:AP-1-like transcription factor [Neurospora sp. IMI 360204]|nr:AP-1-like transcription factor [Neurospora sp. IMI 360204]